MSGFQQNGFGGGGGGNFGSGGGRHSNSGGRGGRGGRNDGRGGRGGRTFHSQPQQQQNVGNGEPCVYSTCIHEARGNCRFGEGCNNDHVVTLSFQLAAHQGGATSCALIQSADQSSPKLISGGKDKLLKVWNLLSSPPAIETSIPANGDVRHIEVVNSTMVWSVDQPVSPDQADIPVGTIYLMNVTGGAPIAVHKSPTMPCTHSMGEIRSFKVANIDGIIYIISAGAEGLIRVWKYDAAKAGFEQMSLFEGHFRAITSLLLQGSFLWSGSIDKTIRVWDVNTGECKGVLTTGHGGHQAGVTSLVSLPANAVRAEVHIASGGMDGAVKIWKENGEYVHSISHECEVMSLAYFAGNGTGIPLFLIGLLNGSIVARSRNTMNSIFRVDSGFFRTSNIVSIVDMGMHNTFSVATDDGQVICMMIRSGLQETK